MKNKFKKLQRGFTLVEMALVLVVIGLILGAVSIGKDMQRNAEYKKMKQKFVDQWVQVYNQNFDRLGYVIGDIEATPMMMVNGELDHGSTTPLPSPTSISSAGTALCGEVTTNSSTVLSLQDYLAAAGIEPPPGRGVGNEDAYIYLDSNGNPQQVSICFQWLPASTSNAGTGNVMVIDGLTPDLARFFDSAIDGQVDGVNGSFRHAVSTSDFTASAWPLGNNINSSGTDITDTEQVQIVRAVYRMNQ